MPAATRLPFKDERRGEQVDVVVGVVASEPGHVPERLIIGRPHVGLDGL